MYCQWWWRRLVKVKAGMVCLQRKNLGHPQLFSRGCAPARACLPSIFPDSAIA